MSRHRNQLEAHASFSKDMLVTYALRCCNGENIRPFWYIGKTNNLHRRMDEHFKGRGAIWCKMHPPLNLHALYKGDIEDSLTLQYMNEFGVDCVRGGRWCARSITRPPHLHLHKKINMAAIQQIPDVKISNWKVQAPVKNKYGGQVWPLAVDAQSKAHPKFQIGGDALQLRIPFAPSCFGQEISSRQSLDFAIAPFMDEIKQFLKSVDQFVIDYVWANLDQFFPKRKFSSKEELLSLYCPVLNTKSEEFDPLLKTKIQTDTCKIFEILESGSRKADSTVIQPNCTGVPIVSLTKIWKMSDKFGATCQCDALMVWPRREKDMNDIFMTDMFKT